MEQKKQVKQEKLNTVSKLIETLSLAKSVVFVDYSGMDMKSQQTLMKKLKEAKASMIVAKNTFFKIAGKESGLTPEAMTEHVLSGQTAMIVTDDDPVAPIQILGKVISETEMPKWKVGVVEGIFYDEASLSRISKLPSKDTLISQVVGGISAPLYGLVATLNGNITKLVYILSAIKPADAKA